MIMPTIALPIVFDTVEDRRSRFWDELENRINSSLTPADSKILLDYPTVYIHYWKDKPIVYIDSKGVSHTKNQYCVYVGESNNVIQRTQEHYEAGLDKNKWQYKLVHAHSDPSMLVIGHEHFNKSLTLDIENQLIEYILATRNLKVTNGRGNPQYDYYPNGEFQEIFQEVWKKLNTHNPDLFLPESEIRDSAIFKVSPFKKLMPNQIKAKATILNTIRKAINKKSPGQLIFVQGEAGTGKTVLTANIFYELIQLTKGEDLSGLKCHLMVNHDQQLGVYNQICKRLNLGENIVSKPTSFINSHSKRKKVDVSFIDEGHLLLTQGKMSYRGNNQLQDIMDRSKVTVVMFDEYQILTTEEYWEAELLEKYKKKAQAQDNYIVLDNQLRMLCSDSTKEWLDDFILKRTINEFEPDSKYEVKSFDSPAELHEAIKAKASVADTSLSRLVATYDWDYKSNDTPSGGGKWGVHIGSWFMPWNYELLKGMSREEKKAISNLAWAEQPHTINEVGSTFTIQGFDLSYVGVILGPAVKYRRGRIVFDPKENKNEKVTRQRTLKDGTKDRFGEMLIRNEVKVLMSRGVSGLYIYAYDEKLRDALKSIAKI